MLFSIGALVLTGIITLGYFSIASPQPSRVIKGKAVASLKPGTLTSGTRIVLGGLAVIPLTGVGSHLLGLDTDLVDRYLAITGGLDPGRRVVVYGLVTLRGVKLPPGTLSFSSRPAWVGIIYIS